METSLAEDVETDPDPVAGQLLLYVAVPQFYHFRLLPSLLTARRWRDALNGEFQQQMAAAFAEARAAGSASR